MYGWADKTGASDRRCKHHVRQSRAECELTNIMFGSTNAAFVMSGSMSTSAAQSGPLIQTRTADPIQESDAHPNAHPHTCWKRRLLMGAPTITDEAAQLTAADELLAAQLAKAAGRVLLDVRESGLFEGRELGRVGDAVSQELLSCALAGARPDDAVLSEEAVDDPTRLTAGRVWIVDPLDGTREFGEGRSDWAVHVALAVNGVPGPSAVALPGLDRVLTSGEVVSHTPGDEGQLRIAVSRSRPPAEAERVAERLGAELVPMGSAGFKAMAVVLGEVDAYLHSGGQYEWDSAAPVGVAVAAGLHASRIDGSPLAYNRPDPRLPDLLVCRPDLADRLLGALAPDTASTPGEK
jgi:3'(2'), 5'-bisphosphate nucleotidase